MTEKKETEKASFVKANLAGTDFEGKILSQADFREANLFDANFKNAELIGTNFSKCDLTGADFENADLSRADLSSARLWHANLRNANLIESDLANADLWDADLHNARMWRTNISGAVSLLKSNFQDKSPSGKGKYMIGSTGIKSAEDAYRTLKQYFIEKGLYIDASWASYNEKKMETNVLKEKKDLSYIPHVIMGLLCGYGERPSRIVVSSVTIILIYAALYWMTSAIRPIADPLSALNPIDYLYYSTITFTTVGYGDIIPKCASLPRLLALTEAFTGVFMMGLFVFTLARKYSAR